jgi:predicted PurR-regulated permease PerM
VLTEVSPVLSLACGLLVAGGVHVVKSAIVRPAVTATTAGASNIPVSILEDVVSTIVSVLSVLIPVLMAVVVIILIAWIISSKNNKKSYQDRI